MSQLAQHSARRGFTWLHPTHLQNEVALGIFTVLSFDHAHRVVIWPQHAPPPRMSA